MTEQKVPQKTIMKLIRKMFEKANLIFRDHFVPPNTGMNLNYSNANSTGAYSWSGGLFLLRVQFSRYFAQ